MSQNISTRRKFLGMTGLMGAGAVLSSCATTIAAAPAKANLDAIIFNFALNLEYLEAAFYLAAVGRLGELPQASRRRPSTASALLACRPVCVLTPRKQRTTSVTMLP